MLCKKGSEWICKKYRPMLACAIRADRHGSILFAIGKFSVCLRIIPRHESVGFKDKMLSFM